MRTLIVQNLIILMAMVFACKMIPKKNARAFPAIVVNIVKTLIAINLITAAETVYCVCATRVMIVLTARNFHVKI